VLRSYTFETSFPVLECHALIGNEYGATFCRVLTSRCSFLQYPSLLSHPFCTCCECSARIDFRPLIKLFQLFISDTWSSYSWLFLLRRFTVLPKTGNHDLQSVEQISWTPFLIMNWEFRGVSDFSLLQHQWARKIMVQIRVSSSNSRTWTQSRVTLAANVDAKSTFDGNSIMLKLYYSTRKVLWESRQWHAMRFKPTSRSFPIQNAQTSSQNVPIRAKPQSQRHIYERMDSPWKWSPPCQDRFMASASVSARLLSDARDGSHKSNTKSVPAGQVCI
jgi:hypothetical protein